MDVLTSSPWLLLVGAGMPFVTALLTKARSPDFFKGVVSLMLALVVAVGNTILADGGSGWQTIGNDAIVVWSAHLITWLGVTGTAVKKLNDATSEFGVTIPAAETII